MVHRVWPAEMPRGITFACLHVRTAIRKQRLLGTLGGAAVHIFDVPDRWRQAFCTMASTYWTTAGINLRVKEWGDTGGDGGSI